MAKRTFLDITSDIAEVKADFWLNEEEIDNIFDILEQENPGF